jgi:hypothetical protein
MGRRLALGTQGLPGLAFNAMTQRRRDAKGVMVPVLQYGGRLLSRLFLEVFRDPS